MGVKFPEKQRYVTLEWPHTSLLVLAFEANVINEIVYSKDKHTLE